MSAPANSRSPSAGAADAAHQPHSRLSISSSRPHHSLLTSSKRHSLHSYAVEGSEEAATEIAVSPFVPASSTHSAHASAPAPAALAPESFAKAAASVPSVSAPPQQHDVHNGGPPLPNIIEPEGRAKLLRRSSTSLIESGLVHSTLQRAASAAGSATKLNMLKKTLQSYANEHGAVDFSAFKEAFGSCLEIDDPVLLASYFRAMEPTVQVSTVMSKIERLTSGTVRDGISFAFAAHDDDGDGFIESGSFISLVMAAIKGSSSGSSSSSSHSGPHGSPLPEQDRLLHDKLATLFGQVRSDWGEDRMSKAEFEDFVLAHEAELNRLREDYHRAGASSGHR